jgi:AbrB family looped-hinge helix DNA binding protein
MDKSGRLVLPKAVREEAGIEPGMPLRIRVRDGRVEIEPEYAKVRLVRKRGITVLERIGGGPRLTREDVERTRREIERRNDAW